MSDKNKFITLTRVSKFAGAEDINQMTFNTDMISSFESSPDGGTKLTGVAGEVQVKEDFGTVYQLITKRTLL